MSNHKSRMQQRRRRFDGWDPRDHNESVAIQRGLKRAGRALSGLQRAFMRFGVRSQR
jgi:hypothetical protein